MEIPPSLSGYTFYMHCNRAESSSTVSCPEVVQILTASTAPRKSCPGHELNYSFSFILTDEKSRTQLVICVLNFCLKGQSTGLQQSVLLDSGMLILIVKKSGQGPFNLLCNQVLQIVNFCADNNSLPVSF